MADEKKSDRTMNQALQSLREGYEESADVLETQPEPIEGKELRERRFPKMLSYFVGAVAVGMLVTAVYLFTLQSKPATEPTIAEVDVAVEGETGVVPDEELLPPPPTPPIFDGSAVPPIPDDAIPPPPEPTPWPTPPIILEP